MESAIYEGWVRHRRFAPVENAFSYSTFMLYLDLDELPELFKDCAFCSYERFNFASFHRKDYLGPVNMDMPLKNAVQALVRERTGFAPEGPVRLLTNLRYAGYGFNPVSFFYCFERSGEQVEAIVAEITNTPWGERHCYVLPRSRSVAPRNFRFQFRKEFHISPYIGMDADYDWRFTPPGARLLIHMENSPIHGAARYFDATMRLERRAFAPARLAHTLLRYPLMTLKVSAGIYFQALKLRTKRCPVHPHPRRMQGAPALRAEPDEKMSPPRDGGAPSPLQPRVSPSWTARIARRLVLQKLACISEGRFTVRDPLGEYSFGAETDACPIHATATIRDLSAYTRMLVSGGVGAAEGYMDEMWSSGDLTALIRIFARNRPLRVGFGKGLALTAAMRRVHHALRRNSRRGSRRNIAEHYDLGNDFFALMLDDTMMYSCAIFERAGVDLAAASRAKNDRICRKLDLNERDHVLEIGGGWGGFAIHAANRYGCRVTTTTISREQHRLASECIRAAGVQDRIAVLLTDYRDLHGQFDKAVSIEMIEAVGHRYLDAYFNACSRLLKPDGAMVIQGITINEQDYHASKRTVDFVKRYIFPGSCLPSAGSIAASIARATDLRIAHQEELSPHYVLTLRAWRRNFLRNIGRIRALGYSERFLRMWEYYLCYCEGAFAERHIGVSQFVFTKPLGRWSLGSLGAADSQTAFSGKLQLGLGKV